MNFISLRPSSAASWGGRHERSRLKDFEDYLSGVIEPIMASPGRKRIMCADLLDHLQESYRMELGCQADESAAIEAAITRLGSADELRLQLQASVPFFERMLFLCLDRKETFMSRWLWIVGVVAMVIGDIFHFPQSEQVFLGGLALIVVLVFRHLFQRNNLASRLIGSLALARGMCWGSIWNSICLARDGKNET